MYRSVDAHLGWFPHRGDKFPIELLSCSPCQSVSPFHTCQAWVSLHTCQCVSTFDALLYYQSAHCVHFLNLCARDALLFQCRFVSRFTNRCSAHLLGLANPSQGIKIKTPALHRLSNRLYGLPRPLYSPISMCTREDLKASFHAASLFATSEEADTTTTLRFCVELTFPRGIRFNIGR